MLTHHVSRIGRTGQRQPKTAGFDLWHSIRWVRLTAVPVVATALLLWHSGVSAANDESASLRGLIEGVSMTSERLMMHAVCDQGQIDVRNGVVSCAECPSYTSSSGEKTGFSLTEVLSGSFTVERENEVLLNMIGCEPDSRAGGGTVLLRRTGAGWAWLHYQKGARLRDCLKFRTNEGTHSLLCNQSAFSLGSESGEIAWVNVTEDEIQVQPLLQWYDNVNSNPRQLLTVFPYRFFRSDFNQDGRSDVRILFRLRDETIPGKYTGAIDAIDAGYKLADPQSLGLIYLFDGKTLSLHKESRLAFEEINRRLKKALPADSP